MRLRSRGLGRKELVMDFREYAVVREGEEVFIVGTIRDPVNWDFTIRFCEDDIAGITSLMFRKPMLGLALRGLFKRRKHHHWTAERGEHVAEGKRRRKLAAENAAERARASLKTATTRRNVRNIREAEGASRELPRAVPALERSAGESG
jgi:hypothetical protein